MNIKFVGYRTKSNVTVIIKKKKTTQNGWRRGQLLYRPPLFLTSFLLFLFDRLYFKEDPIQILLKSI